MNIELLARVLDDSYLRGLESVPMERLREMRGECDELEVGLSYVRRLAQGRLDIIDAEIGRRRAGGAPFDTAARVQELPAVLAERGRAPGFGRLPRLLAPDITSADTAELDAIIDVGTLSRLTDLADPDLELLADRLRGYEQAVSAQRHALHERMDAVQAEITRRYRTGEASVESLLR